MLERKENVTSLFLLFFLLFLPSYWKFQLFQPIEIWRDDYCVSNVLVMKYKTKKIIQNQLVDSNGIEVIFTVLFLHPHTHTHKKR